MNDKHFADSNIWIYLFDQDKVKKSTALQMLGQSPIISTQVIAENINVCLKKLKLSLDDAEKHAKNLIQQCQIVLIQPSTIDSAVQLAKRYQYSFYDSLILAAALENGCTILYSEDFQHGQVIEGILEIKNPFLTT